MQSVGNGMVDPAGEGADGLDFLSNLSFTNFSPVVGMILGDEFADAPNPGYLRAGQNIATGQGAFFLTNSAAGTAEITVVPAQRLAQFNRAPQTDTAPYEQNADFIQVALPLRELKLAPGEHLKIGAVAGLTNISTSLQTRALDQGGIGYSIQEEAGRTWLEGVEFELSAGPAEQSDLQLAVETEPGAMWIRWTARPNALYQVQYSEHPSGPYYDVIHPGLPKRAAAASESIRLNFGPDSAPRARYYRLQQLEP
jgi:hypothetical protein